MQNEKEILKNEINDMALYQFLRVEEANEVAKSLLQKIESQEGKFKATVDENARLSTKRVKLRIKKKELERKVKEECERALVEKVEAESLREMIEELNTECKEVGKEKKRRIDEKEEISDQLKS